MREPLFESRLNDLRLFTFQLLGLVFLAAGVIYFVGKSLIDGLLEDVVAGVIAQGSKYLMQYHYVVPECSIMTQYQKAVL